MDLTGVGIAGAAIFAQVGAFGFGLYMEHINEKKMKPASGPKDKHFRLSPTVMVVYSSHVDFEVWDFDVTATGYQTIAPFKVVTDLCTLNARRIISEEIQKREQRTHKTI